MSMNKKEPSTAATEQGKTKKYPIKLYHDLKTK